MSNQDINFEPRVSCGCGCLPFILTVLFLWALWFGLSTPWGEFNVDIFPPAIRETSGL